MGMSRYSGLRVPRLRAVWEPEGRSFDFINFWLCVMLNQHGTPHPLRQAQDAEFHNSLRACRKDKAMKIVSINPATGETLEEYQEMTPDEVKGIIASAHEAFGEWRRTSFAQRAGLMKKAAAVLRDKAPEYGKLMTQEMGKPLRDGRAEAE